MENRVEKVLSRGAKVLGIVTACVLMFQLCNFKAAATPAPRCKVIPAKLRKAIYDRSMGRKAARRFVARRVTPAIMRESKRFKLDPLLLAAVGYVESTWWRYARGVPGRRAGEVGVFQLIPWDTAVRRSLKEAPKDVLAMRYAVPDGWTARTWRARWTQSELRDVRIGAYVAAYEIRAHVDSCRRRHRRHKPCSWEWKYRKRHRRALELIARVAHFNVGPSRRLLDGRAGCWYRLKLWRAWRRYRKRACAPTPEAQAGL